jgi:ketosteroid isomerase-like protein
MPSPNLDLVRSIYADWERGDYSSIEWAHPEIECMIADGPSPGSGTGVPAMRSAWRDVLDAWEGQATHADGCRELDDERVLVLVTASGRGKTSGLQIQTGGANLFDMRDGKVIKLVICWDRARTLADLGLTPEEGAPDS